MELHSLIGYKFIYKLIVKLFTIHIQDPSNSHYIYQNINNIFQMTLERPKSKKNKNNKQRKGLPYRLV